MYRPIDSGVHARQGESAIQAATTGTASAPAVVLIEPDESVRDALVTLLRGEGWRVIESGGGERLNEFLDRRGVIAVISESSLPDLDPAALVDVCAERGLPLIFTGHELPVQRAVDLIRMGARDYLEKPFPQSRLLDLLNQLPDMQNR